MASDAIDTVAAINAAAAAISSTNLRYTSPEQRRWKSWWSTLWCFGSQKRTKQVVPSSHVDGTAGSSRGWSAMGLMQAGLALAPPSSPASFVNSSVQSPSSFTLSLSASLSSPGPTNTMFTIGPYAHETQLVSPPVFSTFTTEPSTAPFTPPPELAHVTTPSSPDVPFAQLLASSLEAKASARETASSISISPLASPADVPSDFDAEYNFYPGSPVVHLISPSSGMSRYFRDSELPPEQRVAPYDSVASFPDFELATSTTTGLRENMNPQPLQNATDIESDGFRFGPQISIDLKDDPGTNGDASMSVSLISLDESENNLSVINEQHAFRSSAIKNAETDGENVGNKYACYAFSINRYAETQQEICHTDHMNEIDGMSWRREDFYAYITEAALAKREHIHGKLMQQVISAVEGSNGLLMQESPEISLQTCDSSHPSMTRRVLTDDGIEGISEPELSIGLSKVELQRGKEAAQWSNFETIWPVFDGQQHQESSSGLNNKIEPSLHNAEVDDFGSTSSRQLSIKRREVVTPKSPDRMLE